MNLIDACIDKGIKRVVALSTDKASSRIGYAQGSLRAARFLAGRGAGLFTMAQVLGLE